VKALTVVAWLAASAASAQGARLAVHPLELREMTAAQREIVQAQFDVMLARITDIRLAGSTTVEDALRKPAGKGCETRDDCLRFLAEATESLYAVYARMRPDPLGKELVVHARVVRWDGTVVRKVTMSLAIKEGVELTETARKLLVNLIDELELNELSATMQVQSVAKAGAPPLLFPPIAVAEVPVRRPVGYALLGVGAVTLVAGGVIGGLAISGRSKLTPDAKGAVPQAQASRALEVAREGQAATVLLPVGAVVAVVGGLLAWWPVDPPVRVSMFAGSDRAGLHVGGALP
jgi:hypothetical protein